MNKEQQELSEGTMETEDFHELAKEHLKVGAITPLGLDQITPEIRLLASRCILTEGDPGGGFSKDAHKYAAYTIIRERQLLAALTRERELQAKIAVGDGSCDHCGAVPSIIMPTSLCDECADGVKRAEAAEAQLLAKDALIASLKDSLQSTLGRESATTARYDARIEALEAEILKQNKAEEELLATGEKLAEERK